MVRVMGKLEAANVARANTRTEALEDGGIGAGAGCDGIEWMRPSQPCGGKPASFLLPVVRRLNWIRNYSVLL